MGVLIDIVTLDAPESAAVGELVNVSVSVRNQAPGVFTYIAVTGVYNGTEFSFTPQYHEANPGETVSFAGTFIMPDRDTRVTVYAFFWNGSQWIIDDEAYVDVKLKEAPEYKRLVINRDPVAGGTVTSSPSPSTGTVYDGYYIKGTTVYVTAHPNPDYAFKGWSGELTDTLNLTAPVYMTENRTITAHFEVGVEFETLEVDITPVGRGYVITEPASEEGKTKWNDGDTGTFPHGTQVKVTAHPSTGYVFDHWSDEIVGGVSYDNPSYVQDMTEHRAVKAHFRGEDEPDVETLEVDITPIGKGHVTTEPASEEGKTTWHHNETGTFLRGTSVKVTAHPAEGYQFEKWSDEIVGGVSYDNPAYVQDMTEHRTVKAHFKEVEAPPDGEEGITELKIVHGTGLFAGEEKVPPVSDVKTGDWFKIKVTGVNPSTSELQMGLHYIVTKPDESVIEDTVKEAWPYTGGGEDHTFYEPGVDAFTVDQVGGWSLSVELLGGDSILDTWEGIIFSAVEPPPSIVDVLPLLVLVMVMGMMMPMMEGM